MVSESGQEIVASYMEHDSIAYGADWAPVPHPAASLSAVTATDRSTAPKCEPTAANIRLGSANDKAIEWTGESCIKTENTPIMLCSQELSDLKVSPSGSDRVSSLKENDLMSVNSHVYKDKDIPSGLHSEISKQTESC